MANIILPQVNILNEIDDSTKLMVEQNGEINRYPISDLDIGGGDVTIDLDGDNQGTAAGINADTLGGFSADEYLRTGDNSNINAAMLNNQLPEYYLNKDNVANNFNIIEEGFVADARVLKILNDNKLEMELLWENGSPLSSYSEQEIIVDLSPYRYVWVLLSASTSNANNIFASVILRISDQMTLRQAQAAFLYSRNVYIHSNRISFGDCNKYSYGSSEATTDNTKDIPIQIYGIK